MLRRKDRHWLGFVVLSSIVFSAIYTLVTRKLVYPRTFGYFSILALFGAAWIWRAAAGQSVPVARLIRGGILVSALIALSVSGLRALDFESRRELTYQDLAERIRGLISAAGEQPDEAFVLLPSIWGEEMRAYLPADPRYAIFDGKKSLRVAVYLPCVAGQGDRDLFRVQTWNRTEAEMVHWPVPARWLSERVFAGRGVALYRIEMQRGGSDDSLPALIVWNSLQKEFDLRAFVAEKLRQRRWTVPLNTVHYLPVRSVFMLASTHEELAQARRVVAELDAAARGEAFILAPAARPAAVPPLATPAPAAP
jgi:hypothetical protein